MGERNDLPFQSFTFSLVEDKRPRTLFRLCAKAGADGADVFYELHVEKGSAANPSMQFTRTVPTDVAQRLKDALQAIGVFGWDESYGTGGRRRWSANTVFKEGVFAVSSKGGDEVPHGFDDLLEELYRLDFPRPAGASAAGAGKAGGPNGGMPGLGSALNALGMGGAGSFGAMSAGDIGAYAAAGKGGPGDIDFGQMADLLQGAGLEGLGDLMADAQRDPQALQQRMRDEFRRMSPDDQERMLDALASSGLATREWWRRFLGI